MDTQQHSPGPVVIFGAGMMGTAMTWPLRKRGHPVRLVGTHLDAAIIESVRNSSLHPGLGLPLPEGVEAFALSELRQALVGARALVLGVSSAGVPWAAQQLGPLLGTGYPVAMVAKGLAWDERELRVLPDAFVHALPAGIGAGIDPVAIAGPCIAGELAREVPTCVLLTSRNGERAREWAELLAGPYYHVWTETDVIAVEACAALKNAYAMGIALASGLHSARGGAPGSIALHNYEAAVFAQAIWEMGELIRLLGGNPQHAAGLAGVGDLDVTCNGGRTGRFGQLLGQGLGPARAIERMQGATLECLDILRTLRAASRSFEAQGRLAPGALPLAEQLAAIALDGAPVDMPFSRFFGGEHSRQS